jgi:hypothetical protein
MAIAVLLSGLLLRIGAPWDELWHRLYGAPFGEDLLWPPHLFIYASLTLTFLLAAYGLSIAMRGEGSLRERFRWEPLLALLGLFSAYKVAFIPVDLIWHAAIGPDLVAESPPHVFGALAGLGVPLTGVALALSTARGPRGEVSPTDRARWRAQPWAFWPYSASVGSNSSRRVGNGSVTSFPGVLAGSTRSLCS